MITHDVGHTWTGGRTAAAAWQSFRTPAGITSSQPPQTHTLSEGECGATPRSWALSPLDPKNRAFPTSGKSAEVSMTEAVPVIASVLATATRGRRVHDADVVSLFCHGCGQLSDATDPPWRATPPRRTDSAAPSPPHVPCTYRLLTMYRTFLGGAHSPYDALNASGWRTLLPSPATSSD